MEPGTSPKRKIKVLVVDDSALIRSVMSQIVNRQGDMEVVGVASNPLIAREMIKRLNPDVLTLDIDMPEMDGLEFLGRLMRLRPMPVIMVSSLTEHDSPATLRALELGAIDFVGKPTLSIHDGMLEFESVIAEKIRGAASARVSQLNRASRTSGLGVTRRPLRAKGAAGSKLFILGASTGGTDAIQKFLEPMSDDCPGILITQHMPEHFTSLFAKRLNSICEIVVKEAEHGERVVRGHAYIAPGHSHMLVERRGSDFFTVLSDAAPFNRHRPSVDILFDSAADRVGKDAVGVILTGMGKDGAAGMLKMRSAGAYNLAQSEETCVVYGMPRAAVELGAVHEILPLCDLAVRAMAKASES